MATKALQVYKCELCGNMVEVIGAAGGTLTCCNQPMGLLEEKTADAATEKHVPVIEAVEGGIKVKVGSVPHPMTAEHSIQWIEVQQGGKVYCQQLKAGEAPEAFFPIGAAGVVAREYCNLHGLWRAE